MSLGSILRKTRESRGFTASQVATATHMKVQTVEAIEKEDFSQMPAAIYCKGFIKLYAEYLGLDPDPLAREYVERFVEPPPPPEPEQEEQDYLIKPGKTADLPPIVQKIENEEKDPDLFSYGKQRTERPPENLFEQKQQKKTGAEDKTSQSVAEIISITYSKLKDAASSLSKQINEKTDRFKESFRKNDNRIEPRQVQDRHDIDTSPITLPHRKIMIISSIIAGIVLVIFLISAATRFARNSADKIYPDELEQKILLPGRLPAPFID